MPYLFSHIAYSLLWNNVWLIVALVPFLLHRGGRKHLAGRLFFAFCCAASYLLLCSLAAELLFSYVFSFDSASISVYTITISVLMIFVYLVLVYFCFDVPLGHAVCVVMSAYACANVSANVYELVLDLTPLTSIIPYTNGAGVADFIAYVAVRLSVLVLLALLFVRRLKKIQQYYERDMNKWIMGLFFGMLVMIAGCTYIATVSSVDGLGAEATLLQRITSIVFMVLMILLDLMVIFIQFAVFETAHYKSRESVQEHLRKLEEEQFNLEKETIDIINMKCHDMKHQIRQVMSEKTMDAAFVRTVEDSISVFDSQYDTGNKTLDVILTDKALRCRTAGIAMLVMIDGQALNGISSYDINSIFGNLIDNAMEYLKTLSDGEKKFLRIVSYAKAGGTEIVAENYFEGEISLSADGLPKTSKGDIRVHGYGLKSVQAAVEKYDGVMAIAAEDGLFKVKLFFPSIGRAE